jgi:hypothetical protein
MLARRDDLVSGAGRRIEQNIRAPRLLGALGDLTPSNEALGRVVDMIRVVINAHRNSRGY